MLVVQLVIGWYRKHILSSTRFVDYFRFFVIPGSYIVSIKDKRDRLCFSGTNDMYTLIIFQ